MSETSAILTLEIKTKKEIFGYVAGLSKRASGGIVTVTRGQCRWVLDKVQTPTQRHADAYQENF